MPGQKKLRKITLSEFPNGFYVRCMMYDVRFKMSGTCTIKTKRYTMYDIA